MALPKQAQILNIRASSSRSSNEVQSFASLLPLSSSVLLFYTSSLWSVLYYHGASVNMASTTSLPPLDPLYKANAKRTYSVFASCPDQGMKEEEKRCVKHAL